ncbi:MAG: copper chaperone PCu(A)C [Burkholderiaceae bacterium]
MTALQRRGEGRARVAARCTAAAALVLAALAGGVPVIASAAGMHAAEVRAAGMRLIDPVAPPSGGAGSAVPVSMTIVNRGPSPDRLLQASSPVAARVEVRAPPHPGRATAPGKPAAGIDVPSGATVMIGGTGAHGGQLVLTGLRERLVPGRSFPLALTFAHAGRVELTVVVAAGGAR